MPKQRVLIAGATGYLGRFIVRAKERFADELKEADLEHIIVRPNGFFSDMIASTYGQHTIKNYFKEISEASNV